MKSPGSKDIVDVTDQAAVALDALGKPLRAVALLERLLAERPDAFPPLDGAIRIAKLWARAGLVEQAEQVIGDADADVFADMFGGDSGDDSVDDEDETFG